MAGPSDRGEGDGGTSLGGAAGGRVVLTRVFPLIQGGQTVMSAFSKSSCCFVKSFRGVLVNEAPFLA